MVTATFPSSRLARFEHRTGPATPSQVTRGDGVRAVHPGLALVVEEFHRATGGDVEQALARDVNGSLCAHQSTGQPDVTGDNAGDLDRVGVGAKGGPAWHAARNVTEDPPSRRTSLMHG
jgi:hypothetical protein